MAWTPIVGAGEVGATEEALASVDTYLKNMLTLQITALQDVAGQLRLLNARFEEAFETGIDENDV